MERQRNDPQTRAMLENHLKRIGDTEPENAIYWRAFLDGDKETAQRILTKRRIAEMSARPDLTPAAQHSLNYLVRRLHALESKAATAACAG
jgi:hypothetical protein